MGANLQPPPSKDVHLTLYVTDELRSKIDKFAAKAKPPVSRSQAVRYILEKFFESNFDFPEINSELSEPKISRKKGRKARTQRAIAKAVKE